MIIKIKNKLDVVPLATTYYSTDLPSGSGTIPVRNISGFSANWAIQLNNTGQDKAEIVLINSSTPSGTSLVITGTTKFDHPTDTPVFGIKYDQVVFKRSTVGTAGTATAITDGTVNITPDNAFTQFDDTTGASSYAYKVCYRNSVTADISSDSDWLTSGGFSFYSKAKMKERVISKLFSIKNMFVNGDDSVIDTWLNEWLEDLTTKAVAVNKDYLLGTVDVAHGTAGLGTITSTGYMDVRSVWFTTDGVSFFKAGKKDTNDIVPNETYNSVHPYYYFLGDSVIGKLPYESGTARLTFYNRPTPLVNDTDEIPLSMRSYTNSFVDYAVSQAYYLDGQIELGDRFAAKAEGSKSDFVLEISPRNKTGGEMMDITDAIGGEDSIDFYF